MLNEEFLWESQLVEVKSRLGWSKKVYGPILFHRWKLYSIKKKVALDYLYQLPPNTIQAILEHLYANTPVARTNLPAFKACKIISSLPFQSTYYQDILNLLNDKQTADFKMIPRDDNDPILVHSYIMYARCGLFKELFKENPKLKSFSEKKMGKKALSIFIEYIYTGRLNSNDGEAILEIIGSGAFYKCRDPKEIDFLVINLLESLVKNGNADAIRNRALELGLENIDSFIDCSVPN